LSFAGLKYTVLFIVYCILTFVNCPHTTRSFITPPLNSFKLAAESLDER